MTSTAGGSVAIHLKILRACGFCKLHQSTPNTIKRRMQGLYCWLIFSFTNFYVAQEIIYAYMVRKFCNIINQSLFF